MGIFERFRKTKKQDDSDKPDFQLANAIYLEASAKMLGAELSIGARLITSEILGGRSAAYGLVKSPDVFRLGVLGCFAMTAALFPKKKILGIVMASRMEVAKAYLNDRYGANKITAQEYLSAFGIEILSEGYLNIRSSDGFSYILDSQKKMLGFTWDPSFKDYMKNRFQDRMIVHPIIVDDGKESRQFSKS
jgi:hypothetical protein